jgi:bifunctional non-homologous end joining protein LigD
MGLAKYKAKRDFSKTGEPKGGKPLPKPVKGASRFVIQKHDATRLHYDFRLEMEGVLKSWALPKGLPWTKGEKHLAVEVEDHPSDYANFEGIIPEGQYGGGTVMVWDRGLYYVYGEQPVKSLREGKLHLVLAGEKAKGEWTLIRLRGNEAKPQWLILKTGDSVKPTSKKSDDQSVKSGRTMRQIAAEHDAEWQSARRDDSPATAFKERIRAAVKKGASGHKKKVSSRDVSPKRQSARRLVMESSDRPTKKSSLSEFDGQIGELSVTKAKPRFIEPMKAKLVEEPPKQGEWLYELKFDGIRAIAVKVGNKVLLISRNENKLNARFPEIADAVKELPVEECVIDGEVVALDEEGRSSFQLLQALETEGRKSPLRFYAFDLLQLDGKSLIKLPVERRKEVLGNLCARVSDPIRFSGAIGTDAKPLLLEVKRRGLEGLIGKMRNSPYEPGRRSGAWIKLKVLNEQEFVVGGYTKPAGARKYFGALLVGYYESETGRAKKNTRLVFAGRVGTGFTEAMLADHYKKFQKERREDCPFINLPAKHRGRWNQGITPAEMRNCTWLNPIFVAQIKFAEWTHDGSLRQPVFLGLREDKDPRDVRREG